MSESDLGRPLLLTYADLARLRLIIFLIVMIVQQISILRFNKVEESDKRSIIWEACIKFSFSENFSMLKQFVLFLTASHLFRKYPFSDFNRSVICIFLLNNIGDFFIFTINHFVNFCHVLSFIRFEVSGRFDSLIRDCSLFIGSTGPVFCGKDPWKMFLFRQQKFPKKLVSGQWKEGKSPCPV